MQANLKEARVARFSEGRRRGAATHCASLLCLRWRGFLYAVDHKPKRVAPEKLARVKNIQRSPQVALLIDHYEED